MDDGGIFGSWESWVKYEGNMEGVGKCVGMWGEIRESVRRCVRVVESVLGWGQSVVCWVGVGKGEVGCRKVWGEMWDNLGKQGSVGRRVVSRSGTPTLLISTPRPQLPDPNPPDFNFPNPKPFDPSSPQPHLPRTPYP